MVSCNERKRTGWQMPSKEERVKGGHLIRKKKIRGWIGIGYVRVGIIG